MACNCYETKGVFWTVGHLAEFANPRPRKRYPYTKLGWLAETAAGHLLVEGCATPEEAFAKGKAMIESGEWSKCPR